ncbi:MAG: fibronectin type III domain-containing protein, partial [Cyclobacteriaceae bacterium]
MQTPKKSDKGIGYLEYLPPEYEISDNFPCIIFLHGSGESGNGSPSALNKLKKHGPPKLIANGHDMCFEIKGKTECFVVISPQAKTGGEMQPSFIQPFTDYIIKTYKVDPDRIFLTGLSMGGAGTWYNAYSDQNEPTKYAAVAPIATDRADHNKACTIAAKDMPAWAFHGENDNYASYARAEKFIQLINECKPSTPSIFTAYKGVGHNAWERAYDTGHKYQNPNLYEWFLTLGNDNPPGNSVIKPPTKLTANDVTLNGADLTWTDNSDNETGFILEYKKESSSSFTFLSNISANSSSFKVNNLECNNTYEFRIKAINGTNESIYSNRTKISTLSLAKPKLIVDGSLQFCQGESVLLSTENTYEKYEWSNDNKSNVITVTESGNYAVKVFNENCWSNYSDPIEVVVTPLPEKPKITTENTELCDNEFIQLKAPDGFNAYLWSDNQTSQSVSVTIAGDYAVQVQKNGCWSDASDPVKITDPSQPSKPKITFDNSQELCEGQSIQINAPEGFKYYEWSNGETTQSISIDKSATYSVKVANCSNLFSEISDELILDFKAVAAKPLVSVTDGSKEICTGETVTIAGPEDFNQYLWSDGNQSKEVTVSTESSLFLQVKNDDQCWSEPSETVNVSVKPQPDKPTVSHNEQSLVLCDNESIQMNAPEGFDAYLWSDNQTSQSVSVTIAGNYAVQVQKNGCWSDASDPVKITDPSQPSKPKITFDNSQE